MSIWAVPSESIELRNNASEDDLQNVIRAVYRQVLGNAHIMESERLIGAESQLRNGGLTVRQFVSAVGLSDLYRQRFFESSSQYRFIELNFKHFLGRAPQDQAEVSEHVRRYSEAGYEAEIASYVDSDEYSQSFGENRVPYARAIQSQAGQKNVTYNRSFALMRGNSSSDAGRAARLISELGGNKATKSPPRSALAVPWATVPSASASPSLSPAAVRASVAPKPATMWPTVASPDRFRAFSGAVVASSASLRLPRSLR